MYWSKITLLKVDSGKRGVSLTKFCWTYPFVFYVSSKDDARRDDVRTAPVQREWQTKGTCAYRADPYGHDQALGVTQLN